MGRSRSRCRAPAWGWGSAVLGLTLLAGSAAEASAPPAPRCPQAAEAARAQAAQEPVASAPAGEDPERAGAARRAEAEGWAHFQAGRLEEAEGRFRAAVAGGCPDGWAGLAEVYRRRGDLSSAVAAARSRLEAAPGDRGARLQLASILAAQPQRRAEAAALLRELAREDPDDSAVQLELALVLSWSGRNAEAEPLFRRVLAVEDDPAPRARALKGLADCLSWAGRRREAADLYTRAEAEAPPGWGPQAAAERRRGLGDLELWQGRFGSAAARYREALELDPSDAESAARLREAEAWQRPALLGRFEFFDDSADWRRFEALTGARLYPLSDGELDLAVQRTRYEDRSGDAVARTLALARLLWRPDPFTSLEGDAGAGQSSGAGDSSFLGGLAAEHAPADGARLRAALRHDDFVEPVSPFTFHPYNSAFTLGLLRGDAVQSDTVRLAGGYELRRPAGFLADAAATWVEDGNFRAEAYAQGHLRIEHAPGWRSFPRLFYHRSDFRRPSPLYFAPSNLESYGLGVRTEGARGLWRGFGDASVFYQPSDIDAFGLQLAAGLEAQLAPGRSLSAALSWLDSPERGGSTRYRAFGCFVAVAWVF